MRRLQVESSNQTNLMIVMSLIEDVFGREAEIVSSTEVSGSAVRLTPYDRQLLRSYVTEIENAKPGVMVRVSFAKGEPVSILVLTDTEYQRVRYTRDTEKTLGYLDSCSDTLDRIMAFNRIS